MPYRFRAENLKRSGVVFAGSFVNGVIEVQFPFNAGPDFIESPADAAFYWSQANGLHAWNGYGRGPTSRSAVGFYHLPAELVEAVKDTDQHIALVGRGQNQALEDACGGFYFRLGDRNNSSAGWSIRNWNAGQATEFREAQAYPSFPGSGAHQAYVSADFRYHDDKGPKSHIESWAYVNQFGSGQGISQYYKNGIAFGTNGAVGERYTDNINALFVSGWRGGSDNSNHQLWNDWFVLHLSADAKTRAAEIFELANRSSLAYTYQAYTVAPLFWAKDAVSAPGPITGSGTPAEQPDSSQGLGTVVTVVSGSGTPAELRDTSEGLGTVFAEVIGSGTPAEQPDSSQGLGTVFTEIIGSGTPTELPDTSEGLGTVFTEVIGSGTPAELRDTSEGFGVVGTAIVGRGTPVEQPDSSAGFGTVITAIVGIGTPIEQRDLSQGLGTVITTIVGAGTPSEQRDLSQGLGIVGDAIVGRGTPIEAADLSQGLGAVVPGEPPAKLPARTIIVENERRIIFIDC